MVLFGSLLQRAIAGAVLVILVCVSTACLRAAEADEVAGTMPEDYLPQLRQILAESRQRSPELIARTFERLMQEARVTMARAPMLPSLGGYFDYGISQYAEAGTSSKSSRSTGATYNFSFNQALFHWGALKNEAAMARISLAAGDKETARVYRDTSVLLRKAYLALVAEKARLRQWRETLRLVKADVEVSKAKMKDGTISGAALAGDELRQRETELLVNRMETEFAANRARFALAAGRRELREEDVPVEIPLPVYREPLAAAIAAEVLRDNARGTIEAEIYELKLQEARLRQKIVNTGQLPKFGFSASHGQRNDTTFEGNGVSQKAVTDSRIGVGGSWNIFDGLRTRGAKREAAAATRALEQRKAAEVERLMQQVQALERSLALDAEQVALAEIRHGTAKQAHEQTAEGVELGTLPKAELERAEANIFKAAAESMEARATFLTRWSEFIAAAGVDPVLNNLPDRDVRKKK